MKAKKEDAKGDLLERRQLSRKSDSLRARVGNPIGKKVLYLLGKMARYLLRIEV